MSSSDASAVRSPALAPPPGNRHFPLADSVRGLAILAVILTHTAGFAGVTVSHSWPLYLGQTGLCAFFALSGFLLYRPFVAGHAGIRRAPSVRSFARRRALRILPAYWTALTLLSIWPGIIGPFSSKWWVYYGFAHVYSAQTLPLGLQVSWSICVEVSFYLLLPFLAAAASRLVRLLGPSRWWWAELLVVVPFGAVGLIGRWLVQTGDLPVWAANTLVATSDWMAIGMLLAVASVAAERSRAVPRTLTSALHAAWPWWLAAALLLVFAHGSFDILYPKADATPVRVVVNHFLFTLAAGCLLMPVVFGTGGLIRRLLAVRWLGLLGVISYGMYLWHLPLMAWLMDWRPNGVITSPGVGLQRLVHGQTALMITLMLCGTVLAVLAGTLSYYLVELPFLRQKESRRERLPAAVAAAGEVG